MSAAWMLLAAAGAPGLAAAAGEASSHGAPSLLAAVVGLALLGGNAFFVAVEIALLAASRPRIEEAAEGGDPRARRALQALTERSVTFTGSQLGITMCSLGLGAVAEPAVAALLAEWLSVSALPAGAVPALALALALSLLVLLHMVAGEMAPRNLALARGEAIALRLARPFGWYVAVLRPVILLLNAASRLLLRLVRVAPVDEREMVHSPDELTVALAESRERGTIAPQDARMMGAALQLQRMEAEAAMTPRVDLVALPDTAGALDVLAVAEETGYTRVPIYHEDIDHVVGLVHVKDALLLDEPETAPVSRLLRPVTAVPGHRDLERLLGEMLDDRAHAVLVVDEFGGTAGLLSLEDVLEELVGEIDDEFDEQQGIRRSSERAWMVPGTMRRDELERLTGCRLAAVEAETVSGAIVERTRRLPRVGDAIDTEDGWRLTVRTLQGRRAGEVELRAVEPARGRGEDA